MNTQPTLRNILDQLEAEAFALPARYEEVVTGMKFEEIESGSPWYVRFFVGVSAWIASISLIAFLFLAEIIKDNANGVFVGLLFCAIAVSLNRMGPGNDFFGQLGLALSLAGQLLFTMGLFDLVNELVIVMLLLIILEVVLIWVYQNRLHRLISTVVIPGAILAMLFDLEIIEAVHVLIVTLGATVIALYHKENRLLIAGWEELLPPVSYGLAISLLGILILPMLDDFAARWWITAGLLLALMLFLVMQIGVELGLDLRRGIVPWLLTGCVILTIPALRMPGIQAAFIILLLGFWRNNRLLIGLAAAFLVFYLGAYYYSLEWTLLVKSFALTATGAILFLLRYVLLRFTRGGRS